MTSDDHVGNHIAGIGFGKSGTGAGVQAAYLGVRRTQGRFIATDSLLEPREFTTGKRAQVVKSDRECDFAFRTGRLLTKLYRQTLGEVPGTDACWVHVLDQFEGRKELLGPEEFLTPLKLIQNMDPAGVGARDLSECLAIQLREQPPSPEREIALTIALHHLGALARREFARLQQAVGCNEPALRSAHAKIRRLNPRPGAAFSKADARYVVPDVIVRRHRQQWVATINPAVLPTIRVNRRYAEIFRRARDASHAQLGQQLQEARWLVRNTEQRFATILRVAETIVARQKNFFDYGDVAMKPLGLRHIAIELDLHESTISRATGNKYMSTPRGMFEFRHFFSRELDTDTGGTCSATAIRALLREMITAEDHAAPLSDVRLADQLASQGIQVARRTVTKYRRLMQVPPVELRRLN